MPSLLLSAGGGSGLAVRLVEDIMVSRITLRLTSLVVGVDGIRLRSEGMLLAQCSTSVMTEAKSGKSC